MTDYPVIDVVKVTYQFS